MRSWLQRTRGERTAPRRSPRTPFAMLARTAVRLGVPVVLAMQLGPARGVEPVRVGLDGEPIETALELRVDVYSPSAIELFWRRVDVPGVRYEVRRDGELLADTDGASLYLEDLTGGRARTYEVVATAGGERVSELESVRVTLPVEGEAQPGDAGPEVRNPDGADVPIVLRAEIYSATAAELFWSPVGGVGTVYEVRADGVALEAVEGTSYYYDCLVPGEPTSFEVRAVGDDGVEGATASITVHDPAAPAAPGSPSPGCAETAPTAPTTSRFEGIVPFDPVVEADLDGTVDEPLELRLALYSATALELFWNPIPGDGVRYDVIIGSYFITTTGTSQFADGLDLDSAGVAGVIAYDAAGTLLSAQFAYVP